MIEWNLGEGHALWTDASNGGLGHRPPRADHDDSCCGTEATDRRAAIRPGEWLHLTQVHGNEVVVLSGVTELGPFQDREADAAVTDIRGVNLGIATADCAPIALISSEGVVAAVHAGWKGLKAGVIEATVDAMESLGATGIVAGLGPCIHSECYEFGDEELNDFVALWGSSVRTTTSTGVPAFDLPAAVESVCNKLSIALEFKSDECTACSNDYFSFRSRQDDQRQVMLVWTDQI